ncbi:putative aspartic peptidase A1 family, aspartic peptidase domain superfamily [Helianthus annuus]|nr:putative aspartic peptidase A1 family, aspartic peptidase domain superfamily [Helianthus annuus]
MFAHCLDGYNSGGIFAIGHVVQPNVINSTPLIPGEEHYTSYVMGIEVGGEFLNLSNGIVEKRKAIIDSGTSLVYLLEVIYKPLVNKGDLICLGWQENNMGSTSERDIIVLGELILLDKLFLYDLEKQTIG